ncbi:MAG TPA: lysophospholipid acyltransferase family protein [Thermoanaerobaculia bacterium]|nr:lysophospholipid acyltransferase family protein [Thermoanaerobaculia bacterium]
MSAPPDAAAEPPPFPDTAARGRRRKRRRSVLRQRAELALFRLATGALRLLPPPDARRAAAAAARLALWIGSSRRRILLKNLAAAFPEKSAGEIEDIARRSIEGFAAALVDFLETGRLSAEEIRSRVSIAGAEHLAAARARGRGVFLLSAHFGSWEIAALAAGLMGEPIALLVRTLDNPLLEEELARLRRRFGNRPIAKKEAARELLRTMARNESVAILVDQNVIPREAVYVPFFGRLAATTPALALLHLKTGASVVPVFMWPEGDGRYRMEFERPILAAEFGGPEVEREERVRRATARYMEVIEAAIRREPHAWLWLHDRWKSRPPGEVPPRS